MNSKNKSIIKSKFTANIFGVGVNAVTSSVNTGCVAAFSNFVITYYDRMNLAFELPSFLLRFILFIAAAIKVAAVLLKNALKLINVILEIAPRGILFLLSLFNYAILRFFSLSSAEWLMKMKDEDDNSHFFSDQTPLFSLYMQQYPNLFES